MGTSIIIADGIVNTEKQEIYLRTVNDFRSLIRGEGAGSYGQKGQDEKKPPEQRCCPGAERGDFWKNRRITRYGRALLQGATWDLLP